MRRKSKEDPDREARPETHLDEDEDGKRIKEVPDPGASPEIQLPNGDPRKQSQSR